MTRDVMTRQWDELARANAPYSIVSTEEFESVEGGYDAFWASGEDQVQGILSQLELADMQQKTAVEIGCGIGRMTHALAKRFGHVVALDVSPEMIRQAKEHWKNLSTAEFRVCEGSNLAGLDDASVDFVFSWFVLQHIPKSDDVLQYVREAGRVLKGGGRAFLHMQAARTRMEHWWRNTSKNLFYTLPLGARLAVSRMQGGHLEHEFAARYRVWRGSVLLPGDVEMAARSSGMTLTGMEPGGRGLHVFHLLKQG